MNQTIFSGRITKDPEIRYTQSGKAVCNFSIAVEDGYGENKRTYFPSIIAWEARAKYIGDYAKKGSIVIVRCRYTHRDYESSNGTKGRAHEFIADEIKLINATAEGNKPSDNNADNSGFSKQGFYPIDDTDDDDLPF